ncbi:MAG TPA: capsular polysaccharide biosynthesis protein, partial [Burkholderiales bacterium]
MFRPASPKGIRAVVGWGLKPTTKRARAFAAEHDLPYVAIEDGFLRSLGLGVQRDPPLSVVFDDLGIYYDATRASRLEEILRSGDDALARSLDDGRRALALVLEHGLSKYNAAPDLALDLESGTKRVLVVDQTAGDLAVTLGMADASSFRRMLAAAREENPDALILIKTHPDVIAGKRKGYLSGDAGDPRTVLLREDISPSALLGQVDHVYTVSSLLGFEALLRQKMVTCFGMPFYAGWGVSDDRLVCPRRNRTRSVLEIFTAAYLLYSRYVRPETGGRGSVFDVIEFLARQRRYARENAGRLWCFGFQRWKRHYVRPYLSAPGNSMVFVSRIRDALGRGLAPGNPLVVWGHNERGEVRDWAAKNGTAMVRVEDGFIRSVGLGSDLIGPMSLVVDRTGVYYDATQPSDLENLLNSQTFPSDLVQRAQRLRENIVQCKITKYNMETDAPLQLEGVGRGEVILVPGQVEGDASIRFGCRDTKTN